MVGADNSAGLIGAQDIPANVEDLEAYAATIDIAEILDRQKITRFNIGLLLLAFLVATIDGFELGVSAFAGPSLSWGWDQSGPDYAIVLSSSLAVGFVAPAILGYLADRFGRKFVIIAGAFAFGLFAFATLAAISLNQFVVTRSVTGIVTLIVIAFAGMLPVVVSLVSEFAPMRARATMVILVLAGVTFGGGLRGLIGTSFIVPYGAHILLWIAGLAPLAIAPLLLFALPESVKFLALHPARRNELLMLLKRIDNALRIGPHTKFIISGERNKPRFTFGALLQGPLAVLTPLYWISNFAALMAFSYIIERTPIVLLGSGLSLAQANTAVTLFQFGGALAGLLSMRLLDKFGFWPVPVLFACAIPVVTGIDIDGIEPAVSLAAAWFCLLGVQFGNIATASNIYPTYMRAFAVGLIFAVARIGSGLIWVLDDAAFHLHFPPSKIFAAAAVPLIVGLIAALLIVPLYRVLLEQQLSDEVRASTIRQHVE